ncbi:hypothetical protein C8J30_101127 [Rhodobacter viridis]|uniref:2-aminoethylphosphonate-pyruvate transaminase n=1 Tax=Rhodobacter viridis TaxID=1054202 RepID=A0A318U596_9RHOB|nr:hypothetical protein [Rhodobacter viridis]PYF12746.1 hypothetical protein C8J30_101127 [Rhodobacter viridis]
MSPILVPFLSPADPAFDFARLSAAMKARGFLICPGKLTVVESFRIGCIGRIDPEMRSRVGLAVKESLQEMGVRSAAPAPEALAQRMPL